MEEVHQEGMELESERFNMEDKWWPREEEGSGVQTGEPQGRRHTEEGPGHLKDMVRRLEVGNADNCRNNLGSFKPIN